MKKYIKHSPVCCGGDTLKMNTVLKEFLPNRTLTDRIDRKDLHAYIYKMVARTSPRCVI